MHLLRGIANSNPPFTPHGLIQGAKQAYSHNDVIGLFKNPSSHRQVTYSDPTVASEVILLGDLLLRMLDTTAARLGTS